MDLKAVKARLAGVKAFITLELFGQDNCLAEPGSMPPKPLKVTATPPSSSFIMESGQITSIVLRYSETYKEQVRSATQKQIDPETGKKIVQEVKDKILNSDMEQAKQIGVMMRLGKEYLMAKAIDCYYEGDETRTKVVFLDNAQDVQKFNESTDTELAIYIETLDDLEIMQLASLLMSALPADSPANVPLLGDMTDPDTGEVSKGVTASVPADKLAQFPRRTRDIVVEDVPESSGGSDGNSGGNNTV